MTTLRKKLIEVALPLEAINREAAREKSIRHGHPSTLHLWWARRPLAACRAVIFASLVDDPGSRPDLYPTPEAQETKRQELFRLIEELVKWENSNNPRVLEAARAEILRSTDGNPPPVYDPFCGGGSIPLEAQRLGLAAHASDLNPVPVLITKALIEIPPRFAGHVPVNPQARAKMGGSSGSWPGASGLAEDVRYYGAWMREQAKERIGKLYPPVYAVQEADGSWRHASELEWIGWDGERLRRVAEPAYRGTSKVRELTVIAWLWARTVASPNPAARGAHVPLVRSFWLSTKPGKKAWVEPVVDAAAGTYRFEVRTGATGEPRGATVGKRGGECLLTGGPLPLDHIRAEGKAGRLGARLLAIVAEGERGRVYLPPSEAHERLASEVPPPADAPETDLVVNSRYMTPTGYGMTKHRHLFTNRQLTALTTFCDLVAGARAKVQADGGDPAYADAVATYLGLWVGRFVDLNNSLCQWRSDPAKQHVGHLFARQAIPMVWDFAEANSIGDSAGGFNKTFLFTPKVLEGFAPAKVEGQVRQMSAAVIQPNGHPYVFSSDPPYYDNVPYADLSDFFYVWMRRALNSIYPQLLGTVLVPKREELVADPFRQGGKEQSRRFFEDGMHHVFQRMRAASDPRFPTTIYYAFKQEENEDEEGGDGVKAATVRASTGWETFLQSLVNAGWQVDGTWPMRTELGNRMRGLDSNALASSIVLVCRPRPDDAGIASRRDFLSALKRELPEALRHLQKGNIAPVDLAQAAIGPGMAVFSRFGRVLEAGGEPMPVRTALALINQTLDETLAEQEGEFDAGTRWALTWFGQYGFEEGPYGTAETLATARNTSVGGLAAGGVLLSRAGRVRLLRAEELAPDDGPAGAGGGRAAVWEATHRLVRALDARGEEGTAETIALLGGECADLARDLSYRLFIVCERRKWAREALVYNALVQAWPEASRLAMGKPPGETFTQREML